MHVSIQSDNIAIYDSAESLEFSDGSVCHIVLLSFV